MTVTTGSTTFSGADLQNGTTTTQAVCESVGTAVWVIVEGRGDCVRYYASGLHETKPASNYDVLVYFQGDFLDNGSAILGDYLKMSPNSLQNNVTLWAKQANKPYLFIARPGTFGSSGYHGDRRRPREGKLMTAALDAIKAKHHIGTYHMAGQSGGGGLVATMLNMRTDIGCAVIASGGVAIWKLAALKGRVIDTNNSTDSYDPVDHVREIPRANQRIIVLSSPGDQNVLYETQAYYVQQLRAAGFSPLHIDLKGSGSQYHGLAKQGRDVLNFCAQGLPDSELRRRLAIK